MRKSILAFAAISMMVFTLVGCGETEEVKPYTQTKVDTVPVTEEVQIHIEDSTAEEVEDSGETEEESNEATEEVQEPEGNIAPENTEEQTDSADEQSSDKEEAEQELEQEEEYIDNGARSDRTIPMGRAYIGNLEFTAEKVAEKFSGMDSYETNETTAKVAEEVINYLTTKSEYDLINLWSEYDRLEQSQRYALIVLTRYEQSFGGYNKSSMSSALKNSDTYKQDLKTIDSDLK